MHSRIVCQLSWHIEIPCSPYIPKSGGSICRDLLLASSTGLTNDIEPMGLGGGDSSEQMQGCFWVLSAVDLELDDATSLSEISRDVIHFFLFELKNSLLCVV